MGKKKKNKTPAARLELDKSMRKRMDKPDNAVSGMNMLSYTPPPDFSYVLLPATRLCYSPDENISIDVNAICENFGDSDLKFKWKYTELNSDGSTGKEYENTTKAPYVAISSLNNIANDHRILISVTVEDAGNPVKTVDAGKMIIKPVITPKEITDKVEWFSVQDGVKMKANSELDKMVCSVIELYGYNGEDVTVDRFVTFNGGVIFSNLDKLVVSNNCLLVKFNRSEIAGKAKTGDTVTLNYTIQARTGESSDIIKHDFKLAERTLVKEEAADALQPVVCGPVDIRENNFKQCKYTKIEAEYTKDEKGTKKEKITVFQENNNIEALPINLIGGKRKVDIVLSDYTPDKCRLKEGSHKSDNKAILKGYNIKDKEPLDISGGKITREFEYDYPSITDLFCYYLWNNSNNVRQYILQLATCRHNKSINVNLYPDIEWTFHFKYGMKNPLYYRDTWVQMRQHRVSDAVNKAQAADIDGYDNKIEVNFGLSLIAKWNDGTESAEYDRKISKTISSLIGAFLTIKKFVDNVTGKDKGNSTDGMSRSLLERVKRAPLSIEVLSPKIAVGAGWKNKNYGNEVETQLGLRVKADPVIGAKATIDLIAWGKKLHPLACAVITTLDLAAYAMNAEVQFDLVFYGTLILEGNVELSSSEKDANVKAEGRFGFELILRAAITGKLDMYFTKVDLDFEAKAQADGYFSANLQIGMDNKQGLYLEPKVGHSGITITLSLYVKVNGFKRTKKETFPIINASTKNLKKYFINV